MTGPQSSHQRGEAQGLALDFAYLTRQTFGDADLQYELLAAFRAQAEEILQELQKSRNLAPAKTAGFAHLLKGSALAIGAAQVAAAAENLEMGAADTNDAVDLALADLAASIVDVSGAIDLFFTKYLGK
ncbi:MAG: Hpt domain-containing protein [Methylocella sp.]